MKTIVAILFAAIALFLSKSQQTIAPVAADLAPQTEEQAERLLLVYTANYYAVMADGSTVEVLQVPISEVIEVTCDEEMQATPQTTY